MTYDENVFKEKANRKARKIWIVFAVLLSANYGSDASGGLYPTTSYLIFLALCWLPLIFGEEMCIRDRLHACFLSAGVSSGCS